MRSCGPAARSLSSPPSGRQNDVRFSRKAAVAERFRTSVGYQSNAREFHGRSSRLCIARRADRLHACFRRAGVGGQSARGRRSCWCRIARFTTLTLGRARETAQVAAVRGRILYDFDGNACEGYTLQFRQVSELDTGEGKKVHQRSALDDLGGRRRQAVQVHVAEFSRPEPRRFRRWPCRAWRRHDLDLAKPEHKVLDIDAAVVFPTQHMVRVIEAARAGKTILDFPVFDGSDTGEKVYDTLTVIGRKLAADDRKHDDAAADGAEAGRGRALAGDDQLFRKRQKPRKTPSRRRSMRSASSFTRTAFRARCRSITTISSSPANSRRWRSETQSLASKRPCK